MRLTREDHLLASLQTDLAIICERWIPARGERPCSREWGSVHMHVLVSSDGRARAFARAHTARICAERDCCNNVRRHNSERAVHACPCPSLLVASRARAPNRVWPREHAPLIARGPACTRDGTYERASSGQMRVECTCSFLARTRARTFGLYYTCTSRYHKAYWNSYNAGIEINNFINLPSGQVVLKYWLPLPIFSCP